MILQLWELHKLLQYSSIKMLILINFNLDYVLMLINIDLDLLLVKVLMLIKVTSVIMCSVGRMSVSQMTRCMQGPPVTTE